MNDFQSRQLITEAHQVAGTLESLFGDSMSAGVSLLRRLANSLEYLRGTNEMKNRALIEAANEIARLKAVEQEYDEFAHHTRGGRRDEVSPAKLPGEEAGP